MSTYNQILTILFGVFILPVYAQSPSPTTSDEVYFPLEGKRCSQLKEKHRYKRDYKLKLTSLLERNLNLKKNMAPHKQTLKNQLDQNEREIRRELKLTLERLANMEEDMVRKGCPGIRLQHVSSELSAIMEAIKQ